MPGSSSTRIIAASKFDRRLKNLMSWMPRAQADAFARKLIDRQIRTFSKFIRQPFSNFEKMYRSRGARRKLVLLLIWFYKNKHGGFMEGYFPTLIDTEREYFTSGYIMFKGNMAELSRRSGVSVKTLYNKFKKFYGNDWRAQLNAKTRKPCEPLPA